LLYLLYHIHKLAVISQLIFLEVKIEITVFGIVVSQATQFVSDYLHLLIHIKNAPYKTAQNVN